MKSNKSAATAATIKPTATTETTETALIIEPINAPTNETPSEVPTKEAQIEAKFAELLEVLNASNSAEANKLKVDAFICWYFGLCGTPKATLGDFQKDIIFLDNLFIPNGIMVSNDDFNVLLKECQLFDAIQTHLLGEKKNKSAFSKAYFQIFGTTKETFNDAKKAIISIFEANNLKTDTYNFIGNYFAEYNGTPYDKGNGTTVKAKTAEPTQTTEQQNTLKTLSQMFGVDSDLYKQAEAQILADVENRKKEWAKEVIENDKRSKSTFVKNYIRTCNDTAFLNTLYELCKTEEAKQAMQDANRTQIDDIDDNQPF